MALGYRGMAGRRVGDRVVVLGGHRPADSHGADDPAVLHDRHRPLAEHELVVVVARKAALALALARAISGVTQNASSMRWQATRWPASSTTAMATLNPSSRALAIPLSMQSRAFRSVNAISGHLHPDLVGFDADAIGRDGEQGRHSSVNPFEAILCPTISYSPRARGL